MYELLWAIGILIVFVAIGAGIGWWIRGYLVKRGYIEE